jgi:hypothetical protein
MTDAPDRGDLTVKASGKQTIFVYNQANLSVASPEQMAELEDELKHTKEQLAEKAKELKSITSGKSPGDPSRTDSSMHQAIAAKLALSKTKDLQTEIEKVRQEVRLQSAKVWPD